MKIKLFLLAVMVVSLLATNATAYNLELTPGNSKDVTGDSFFDVLVVFNPDSGGNTLGTFAFNLFYDTTELTYNDYELFLPSPVGPSFMAPFESPVGKINNLGGNLPFGAAALTIDSPYTLAQITFDINDPGVNKPTFDGSADVWFDTAPGGGFTVDGQFDQISSISLTGTPDIAVAPEPVSSTLFLIGAATLGFRRFRKA